MQIRLLAVGMVVASACWGAGQEDGLTKQGEIIAKTMCAGCHAVDASGQSPHEAAPAFRRLDQRLDLDSLVERLREGLMSGHSDMPTFRFAREDARALVAYLRSIQGP